MSLDMNRRFEAVTDARPRREVPRPCNGIRVKGPGQNEVETRYVACPERLFVIDQQGTLIYAGIRGVFGFVPKLIT